MKEKDDKKCIGIRHRNNWVQGSCCRRKWADRRHEPIGNIRLFTVPRPGWLELEASCLWNAVQQVIREVARRNVEHLISSVCVWRQWGIVLCRSPQEGEPLGNVILAADARSVAETEWLVREIGRENLFRMTGMPSDPMSASAYQDPVVETA